MLHGVTRRWQSFTPSLPSLSTRWQTASIDFRGHGLSYEYENAFRVVDYVADAIILVNQFPDTQVVLYGHSLGAMVAAAVAVQLPERILAIVLEDPPLQAMGERIHDSVLHSFFSGMANVARGGGSVVEMTKQLADHVLLDPQTSNSVRLGDLRDDVSLRFTASCLKIINPNVFEPILSGQWLEGYDIDSIFPQIQCPTLLLHADPECGGMLSNHDAKLINSNVPDCSTVKFKGSPHLIHWAQTQNLLNTVHAFLESVAN